MNTWTKAALLLALFVGSCVVPDDCESCAYEWIAIPVRPAVTIREAADSWGIGIQVHESERFRDQGTNWIARQGCAGFLARDMKSELKGCLSAMARMGSDQPAATFCVPRKDWSAMRTCIIVARGSEAPFAHEIGHMLGFAHSADHSDVMYRLQLKNDHRPSPTEVALARQLRDKTSGPSDRLILYAGVLIFNPDPLNIYLVD